MVDPSFALPSHVAPHATRVAVLNAKGGTGKSTIAMNLAIYYARLGLSTALYDFDPQESSIGWIQQRPRQDLPITGIAAARRPPEGITRSWQLKAPGETDRVIIDTPAGLGGKRLAELVRSVDCVVVPITPSPLDTRATAQFISTLLLVGKAREQGVAISVVANRFRANSKQCTALGNFLTSLRIPVTGTLSESQHYLAAAERGLGIHELPMRSAESEQRNWNPVIQWLERQPTHNRPRCAARVSRSATPASA